MDRNNIRSILNTLFMILAVIGLILYFCYPSHHIYGMTVIVIGMVLKLVEFIIRFMF